MKEKIVIFLLGLLLGAVISTGSIYVYTTTTDNNQGEMQMGGMDQNGQSGQNGGPGDMQVPGQGSQNETSTQSN